MSRKVRQYRDKDVISKICFYIFLIVLWQLIYFLCVDLLKIWKFYSFPSPVGVVKSCQYIIADHTIGIALWASLRRILAGYGISILIGASLGFVLNRFRFVADALRGPILGLQTLPSICWLPFAILWFGLNEGSILFVIIIGSLFSIAMAVDAGIRNINPIYLLAGRNMGARGISLYTNIIIPAALPTIISGMKQGWSFAWRGLIAGEMLSASIGLGQLLMTGRELADINQITVIMIVIIIIGVIVEKNIFGRIENKVLSVRGLI